jgi:2'-5' RNA ligase
LLALRERLLPLVGGKPADEYLPRLTLGRIVGPVDGAALARASEWFRDRPIGSVRVERIGLARVRRRPFHWIQVLAELPLGARGLV